MTHPWHTYKVLYSTVLISYIVMCPPAPAKNKSKAVWIPVSHFTHLKLCMAQPPALPIYKKGIIERITVVMHTLFTFCTHHTSNHKNLFKIVNGTQNPTKTSVTSHKCQMYWRIVRWSTPLIGANTPMPNSTAMWHRHYPYKPTLSRFPFRFFLFWLAFCVFCMIFCPKWLEKRHVSSKILCVNIV